MNKESIKKKKENIQQNCGNCIYSKVCSCKDTYVRAVSRVIYEAQEDSFLIEVLCKCKYYNEQMGYQPKFDGTFGYQPVHKSTTLTTPPMTGSKVVEPKLRKLNDNVIALYEDLQNYIQEKKAEAYKEFAKRLENKIKTECNPYGKPTYDYDTSISILHYIDKLIEEMITDKE